MAAIVKTVLNFITKNFISRAKLSSTYNEDKKSSNFSNTVDERYVVFAQCDEYGYRIVYSFFTEQFWWLFFWTDEGIISELYFSAHKIITSIKSERGSVLAVNKSPLARVSVVAQAAWIDVKYIIPAKRE